MEEGAFGAELIFNGLGGDGATGSGEARFRTHSDWSTSEWGPWRVILDSDNYSSYASPIGHTHPYLPLSGGTLTGSLSIVTSGESALILGSTTSGISGSIYLYAAGSRYTKLVTAATGASHTITFPNADGTVSLEGHTHNYLPLTGGNITGTLDVSSNFNARTIYQNGVALGSNAFSSTAYLALTSADGQVVSSSSGLAPVTFQSGDDNAAYIGIKNPSGTISGYYGFNSSGAAYYTGSTVYYLYHTGNLPAYPTKASWNYDDRYLKLSGGSLSGSLSMATSGETSLSIGNGTSGNYGAIYLYASGSKYTKITSLASGAYQEISIPNASGTFALTSDLSAYSTTSHNHDSSYLKLTGGTLSGNLNITAGSESALVLGTATSGEIGALYIYASGSKYHKIVSAATGQFPTITLPNASGTISLEGHTHSYLPLSGGTLTGDISVKNKYNFAGDPTGYDYGGLYRNSQITSGGDATTLWLYSYNAIRIEGSSVTINGGTPITSSNIGSQSVNYAASAGNADTVDGYHYNNLPYLPLSGGTISGGINPNSDSIINLGTATAKYHYIYAHRLVRLQSIAKGDTYDSYQLTLPDKSGIIATTSDIPSLSGYATQSWVGQNYLPLSGGTMSGNITMGANSVVFNQSTTSNWNVAANTGIMLLNTVGASATGAPGTYYIGLSVSGYYGFQLATYGGGGTRLLFRNTSRESYPSWSELAFLSDLSWNNISSKPDTATRWPSWSEVTDKPSTFTPSSHSHTNIASLGNKNASDLSSTYPSGLSTSGIYNNGYPFSYGCCMTSTANGGAFQIAGQWNSDVTGESNYDFPTEMYIRGRRDSYDVWTTWTRVVTNRNWSSIISISTLSNSEIDSIIV